MAVGIFATFDDVLLTAGPVGIWLWIIVAVGQALVALVVAQFAARIALSGSSYQWASRLANPKIGWFFGWLTFWYLATSVVALDNALASQAFMPLVGLQESEDTARLLTVAIMIVQAVLIILSTRLLGLFTSMAVGLQLAIVAVLVLGLGAVMVFTGSGDIDNLTSRGITAADPNYFAIGGGLMAATIMGLTTLVGFDSAANLAEEAKDPFRSVPRNRGIGGRRGSAWTLVPRRAHRRDQGRSGRNRRRFASRRDHPQSARAGRRTNSIGRHRDRDVRCRHGGDRGMLTAGVRNGKGRTLPGARLDATGEPAHANPGPCNDLDPGRGRRPDGRSSRCSPDAIDHRGDDPACAHLRRDHDPLPRGAERLEHKQGGFSLGRFELPVAIAALIWVAVALVFFVTPGDATVPALVVLGLILAGGVYFAKMMIFNREVLDTEPGVDIFAAAPEATQ